ncbi:hypothetical protein RQ479_13795 [Mesorhizobium sp. ISC25]|uniref:hypothetical protein n=1 Tax=Mesorhizobium sp. ISC25 TaxID=3077335 RepID=UPI0035D8782D
MHVLPCGETFSVENDHARVKDLVRRLAALSPAVVAALAGAGLTIVVVNPARV